MARGLTTLVLLLAMSTLAYAQTSEEVVGSITTATGDVTIVRGDSMVNGSKGVRLLTSDVILTAEDASVGIVLRDDTTLSLGSSSELKMSEFTFKPDEGILGMTLSMAKGTLVYISGQISKLAPGSAKIETPSGVAAVRGTELLIEVKAR